MRFNYWPTKTMCKHMAEEANIKGREKTLNFLINI